MSLTKRMTPVVRVGRCRCCKCTAEDCSQCVERTGDSCRWVNPEQDLCSACICDKCGLDAQGLVEPVLPRISAKPAHYADYPSMWCSKCRQANAGLYRRSVLIPERAQ